MTLLDDEVRLIENHFYLIGRKDPARCKKLISEKERLTPNQLTQHLDKSKPILIIDHQPKELSLLADAGADLILGGHTNEMPTVLLPQVPVYGDRICVLEQKVKSVL